MFVLLQSFWPPSQEYFLRSELTSALLSKDPSLVCSTEDCQNHIIAESILSICRLPVRYVSVSLLNSSKLSSKTHFLYWFIQCVCYRWTAWTWAAFCVWPVWSSVLDRQHSCSLLLNGSDPWPIPMKESSCPSMSPCSYLYFKRHHAFGSFKWPFASFVVLL